MLCLCYEDDQAQTPFNQLLRECLARVAPDGGGDPRGPGGVWRSFMLFSSPALDHFDTRNVAAGISGREKLRDRIWRLWRKRHPDVRGFDAPPSRTPLPWESALLHLFGKEPFTDKEASRDEWFVIEVLVRDITATNDFLDMLRRWDWYPTGAAGPGDVPMLWYHWRGKRAHTFLSIEQVAEEFTEGVTRLVVIERNAKTGDEVWEIARELASGRNLTVKQNLRQLAEKGVGHDGTAKKRRQMVAADVAVWVLVITESDSHIPSGAYARTRVAQLDLVTGTAAAPDPFSRTATEYAHGQTLRAHWLGLPPCRLLPRTRGPHIYLGAVVGEWASVDPNTGEAFDGSPQP